MRPDVVIIGGGQAGRAAALAANWKRRVTVVDEGSTLSPKQLEQGMLAIFIEAINSGHNFEMAALLARDWRLQQQQTLPAKRHLQEIGITVITDFARVNQYGQVRLDNNGDLSAGKIVLATGSAPIAPDIPGDQLPALADIFNGDQPSRVVIIGDHPISDQLISALSRIGTRVSTIDEAGQVASVERLQKAWRLNTITDGYPQELGADWVLVWPRRQPRVDGIVGPVGHPDGIQINRRHQTNQRGLYAIGSCLAPGQAVGSSIEQGLLVGQRLAARW